MPAKLLVLLVVLSALAFVIAEGPYTWG